MIVLCFGALFVAACALSVLAYEEGRRAQATNHKGKQ